MYRECNYFAISAKDTLQNSIKSLTGASDRCQPIPQTVETTLQVSQAPLADTARYDSLRAVFDQDPQNCPGHEQWVALGIYANVRDKK